MCSTEKINNSEPVKPNYFQRLVGYATGIALSLNFAIFWAIPIVVMGGLWKAGLRSILEPLYRLMDENKSMRFIAETYVYNRKEWSDYFAISLLLIVNFVICFGGILYYQMNYGDLPYWMIAAYYFSWVGVGGRIMGAAYTLAHREGHQYAGLYKSGLKSLIGNFFENNLGCFFGNVPWNFTTSHVFIHHRLDGGMGDTFYEWDLDRTNLMDFMLYVQRIFLHMIGYSSMKFFKANGQEKWANLLRDGIVRYIVVGTALFMLTQSPSFIFWIYIQPLFCMTYFLALLNIGFHGFIEFDENGNHIEEVNSTIIIEGDDGYFGEDDHNAHNYASHVFHRDLPDYQVKQQGRFEKRKGSVSRGLSIAELSIFIIFGLWDELAKHYVDYSGKMSKEEIIDMLKIRATTKETSFELYSQYLSDPTAEARKKLFPARAYELKGKKAN